jgi:acyl-CoA thioester hydrolase
MQEVWRGNVNAWECDENAHLNVRFWLAKAHEALQILADLSGLAVSEGDEHIRFLREARAGASLYGVGGLVDLDVHGSGLYVELRISETDEVCMTITRVLRAVPETAALDPTPSQARVEMPAHGHPRGLTLDPPRPSATRREAEELGLRRVGLRRLGGDYVAGDGLVRRDAVIGLISDSIGNLHAFDQAGMDPRGDTGVGGVALEYRLAYRTRPAAGAQIEIWSGPRAFGEKVMTLVHWHVEARTGAVWATCESVTAFFDLTRRKLIPIPARQKEGLEAHLAPAAGL